MVGLLRICLILATTVRRSAYHFICPDSHLIFKPSLRDQIYISFDLLARLPPSVATSVAEQLAAGLVLIVTKHRSIIRSQTEWSLVFALMRATISHSEASRELFELMQSLVNDGPSQCVTPDNFVGMVVVLDEYATIASEATAAQQQGRRTQTLNASKCV